MEKFTIDYSTKNIPIPSRKLYIKTLTDKVEKVIKRMRWKVYYYDKEDNDTDHQETYGFKTTKCPPQNRDLINFENDLLDMIRNISFKPVNNEFQTQLKNDIDTIRSSDKAFIPADKSRNFYEMTKESHDKLYVENITKTYRKTDSSAYNEINEEAKSIAKDLNLSKKVECLARSNAFITIKDHKDDFPNRPKCRLINPAKPELGKVSKFFIDKANKDIRNLTKVNQWHSTSDVIEWFKNIKDKQNCYFIQYDIEEFYPSISKELLIEALSHANNYTEITQQQTDIIMHARKSLLFSSDEYWEKSSGDPKFDVTMGSYDGAELCELVGLYILHTLGTTYGTETNGLYRDDGLGCFKKISDRKTEKIKQDLIKTFREKFKLKITIEINDLQVSFLDVTLSLIDGSFKPYMKPNNLPVYINAQSNHPPNIIKRIPSMIQDRINNISSSKEIFDRSSRVYNDALKKSGFKQQIKFKPKTNKVKKHRSRKIIWFNPPYSINVRTNVAKKFLNIVSKNFPKSHRLNKLFNRNNLKVSYSCLPNVSCIISGHNKKILNSATETTPAKTCNCTKKNSCPLNGKCLDSQVIYKCHVRPNENENGLYYIGLTGNTFKDRYNGHNYTFRHESKENSTENTCGNFRRKTSHQSFPGKSLIMHEHTLTAQKDVTFV